MPFVVGHISEDKVPTAIINDVKSNARIYGVHFDGTNSVGERTYDAKDLQFSPSNTTTAGDDDFITLSNSPFNIKECITDYNSSTSKQEVVAYEGDANWSTALASGTHNRFIEFPKFYYKRPSKYTFAVSTSNVKGFSPSPMHYRNGVMHDKAYVSKYTVNSAYRSQSGQTSLTNGSWNNNDGSGYTISVFRNGVRSNGMQLFDYAAHSTILMLMLIKYNTLNVQDLIGFGNSNTSAKYSTGGGDGIKGLDGFAASSKTSSGHIKCFGIENYYGNIWKLTDGLVAKNVTSSAGTVYINTDIENITSNPTASSIGVGDGYVEVATKCASNSNTSYLFGWTSDVAFDNQYNWAMYPTAVYGWGNGSDYQTNHGYMICDGFWSPYYANSNLQVCLSGGGYWGYGFACGPFSLNLIGTLAAADPYFGASAFFLS